MFDPFIVKMKSEKYFSFFPIFTKEIQAKINELESECKIFAFLMFDNDGIPVWQ